MANRYPTKEAGPTKKKKQPSVNRVGVNRQNMYTKTEFPGTGVSIKGEPKSGQRKPNLTGIGNVLSSAVLLPVYTGAIYYEVAKQTAAMGRKAIVDLSVKTKGKFGIDY